MFTTAYQKVTSGSDAGSLTWELGAYGDRAMYRPPLSDVPQVYTDLSFACFSPSVSVSAQAIHELLHPFGRQLALRYGEALSQGNQSGAWNGVELGLFDPRVEIVVVGLQQRLFPEPRSAPTVRFSFEDEKSAANVWLQGASELLGAALLQEGEGEERAEAIRSALLPPLTALSSSCELRESGRDRMVIVEESPVFSPLETSVIMRALIKGVQQELPSLPFQRRGEGLMAETVSQLFLSVYGGDPLGVYRLLRDFTDCYPGPEFRSQIQSKT